MPIASRTGASLAAVLSLLVAADAYAAGYYVPGRGARAAGRAGAFVASCDSPQCLWYNPAGLAGLRGHRLLLDAGTVVNWSRFERASRTEDGRTIEYQPVNNSAGPTVSPGLMMTSDATLETVTFGLGLYAPYASRTRFPERGAQRYTLIENMGTAASILSLGVGWEPIPRLRIGATIQNWFIRISSTVAASGYSGLFGRPEDEDLDFVIQGVAEGNFHPTASFGIWGQPIEPLQLAFSAQLPVSFSEIGDVRVRFPSNFFFDGVQLEPENPRTRLNLDFPLILRFAARTEQPTWDVELAFVWERWSAQQAINVSPVAATVTGVTGVGTLRVDGFEILTRAQDTLSIRLGGHYDLNETVELRGGYGFEMSAFDDATYSVFVADGEKHTLSAGASFALGWGYLDLSYAVIINTPRTVTSSELTQVNPFNEEGALVVGNGDYSSGFHVFGTGLRVEIN